MGKIKRHRRRHLPPYFIHGSIAYGSDLCFLKYLKWRTIFLAIHHGLVCGPTVHDSYSTHVTCNSTPFSQRKLIYTLLNETRPLITHLLSVLILIADQWQAVHKLSLHCLKYGIWSFTTDLPQSRLHCLLMCVTWTIYLITLCSSFLICAMVTKTIFTS